MNTETANKVRGALQEHFMFREVVTSFEVASVTGLSEQSAGIALRALGWGRKCLGRTRKRVWTAPEEKAPEPAAEGPAPLLVRDHPTTFVTESKEGLHHWRDSDASRYGVSQYHNACRVCHQDCFGHRVYFYVHGPFRVRGKKAPIVHFKCAEPLIRSRVDGRGEALVTPERLAEIEAELTAEDPGRTWHRLAWELLDALKASASEEFLYRMKQTDARDTVPCPPPDTCSFCGRAEGHATYCHHWRRP